jgi:15,16-dihydrobiliverdin:ferredoxin oxidoreductase
MLSNHLIKAFPALQQEFYLGKDILPWVKNKDSTILSYRWSQPKIKKARLCWLNVPGKFFAETLVIYPSTEYDIPIFGCEYLNIAGKKFFGGIDFHPISQTKNYANEYLECFPDTDHKESKFYDLNKFFSNKFWISKRPENFYEEYLNQADSYLAQYCKCVDEATPTGDFSTLQAEYNYHMAENDPARGILKAYFSAEFAEHYIHNFLFSET